MKFSIGQVTRFKLYKKRNQSRTKGPGRNRPPSDNSNYVDTLGIITARYEPGDMFKDLTKTTQNDNGYIWLSYVDGMEFLIYEDEMEDFDLEAETRQYRIK